MTEQPYVPDAGDLIWLDLNPRTGHEQSGDDHVSYYQVTYMQSARAWQLFAQ